MLPYPRNFALTLTICKTRLSEDLRIYDPHKVDKNSAMRPPPPQKWESVVCHPFNIILTTGTNICMI